MSPWILVTLIGGCLAAAGLALLVRRYREGEVTGRYLAAVAVGLVSLASYALLSTFRPALCTGRVTLALLLPAFVAIVVVAREHEKATSPTGS